MWDYTCQMIFTNYSLSCLNQQQVSMVIQSLNPLCNSASADQLLTLCQINTTKVEGNLTWQVILHPGTFHIQGKASRALAGISPRYFPSTNYHPLFVAMTNNYNYAYFAKDANRWDSMIEAIWGSHNICPFLMQFHVLGLTRVGLSALCQTGGWGNPKRPLLGMAYFLLVPAQEVEEEKRFSLAGVWVHPNQTLLPSLEEAAKQLTLLISTKKDWCYAFVWVNEDMQHLPLSNAGHISVLVDGTPGRSTCGQLSQLEVCQLLYLGGVVIYPKGLNGGLEPLWVTLPNLPLWEAESTSEDTWLQITLPRPTQGDSPGAVSLWLLTPVSSPHSITECPSEVVTGPSMTEEIEELLSNPMFKMPGESSMYNSSRRQPLTDPLNPMASKEENPPIQERHSWVT